jgi:EAL and modified HD-GYP domain-containing signal transduction protein
MDIYLARQPIFTRTKKVHGYELLFRGGMENCFPGIDGDRATSRILSGTFFTTGIERLTNGSRAYINFPRNLITRKIPLLFPPEITTVEILEDVEADPAVVDACREFAGKGYTLALDDFAYRKSLEPLIDLCHVIKVDFKASSPEEILDLVRLIDGRGKRLVAEKVETASEFEAALKLGFTLFQGYFFSRPEIIRDSEIPSLKMNLMRIVGEARHDDYNVDKLKGLIEQDVGVSYKLLRYLNSPFFRRISPIRSIRQAIVMLGEKGIRGFLSVIILAELGQDKPDELIKSSIVRARMCERMGMETGSRTDPSELFVLGLFSHVDAILDNGMDNILRQLPLAGDIKEALAHRAGSLAPYLRLAEEYQAGSWDKVSVLAHEIGLREQTLPGIYMDALGYADALFAAV